MTEKIVPIPTSIPSVKPGLPVREGPRQAQVGGFQEILQEKLYPSLKISAHAQRRMQNRGINLTSDEIRGVREAVGRAQAKGCRESLVVLDRVALVVSVKNQTVVTAVDNQSMKENVFTNIDSAVFVRES